LKKIQDGIHPFAGSPVIKVGSYISEKLYYEYGKEKLDYCRRSGVIAFIKAYIDLYRKGNLIPEAFQLSKKIENHVLKWEKSWSKTWNEQTKIYSLFPAPLIWRKMGSLTNKTAIIINERIKSFGKSFLFF
jgi:hypothetical protein